MRSITIKDLREKEAELIKLYEKNKKKGFDVGAEGCLMRLEAIRTVIHEFRLENEEKNQSNA